LGRHKNVRLNWLIGFQPCHYTISLVYRTYRILPGYLPGVDVGGAMFVGVVLPGYLP
jgi:hypothetical protein